MRAASRSLFVLALVFSSLLTVPAGARPSVRAPDVVMVLLDDLGYSDLGCYGSEIETPHIDRLAAGGIRFTQFLSENKCNPSRTSLMTGQYYIRGYQSGRNITIPEGLKAAGYRSYLSGKWDVVDDSPGGPLARGFDRFFGTIQGCGSQFAPLGLQRDGRNAESEWSENPAFYYTDAITDHALSCIRETPEDSPFFLLVSYTAPHWPLHAKAQDIAKYQGRYAEGWDVLRARRLERMKAMGIVAPDTPLPPRDNKCMPWEGAGNKEWQQGLMEVYAAMVDAVDQGVGRLVAALEEEGRIENTVFMLLSDNGASSETYAADRKGPFLNDRTRDGRPMQVGNLPSVMPGPEESWQCYGPNWSLLSSTPFRLYKGTEHQGGHAVPLILHWPAQVRNPGSLSDELCHIMDLFPTLLDAAGQAYPSEFAGRRLDPLDGRSLLPLLQTGTREGHEQLCWGGISGKAIRRGNWKLVQLLGNPWELYDLDADRTELQNLASEFPERVNALEQAWKEWAAEITLPPGWRDARIFDTGR